ncbi:MAG: tyrosine-protein phosphatase [Pseudomonadota bacterium]
MRACGSLVTALVLLSAVAGCSDADHAATPEPSVDAALPRVSLEVAQGDAPAEYALSWASGQAFDVYVATSPDASLSEATQLASDATSPFRWQAEDTSERRYFSLARDGVVMTTAAMRLLPLEGGRNFRDLGGYETSDGQRVRWGRVFRSGAMHKLTAADYEFLGKLGIATVCDYRAEAERQRQPTQWAAEGAEYLTFPDPEDTAGSSFMTVFKDPEITPAKVSDAMAAGYASIAKQHAPAYAAMFDRLAAGEIPLAFNCSAGKDRAGMSAALLLTALGVPRETVVEDYALSEQYVDYMAEFLDDEEASAETATEPDPYAFLKQLPREVVAPLMRSDPKYVTQALDDLEAEFGSLDAFIRDELEVTEAELRSIKAALLES